MLIEREKTDEHERERGPPTFSLISGVEEECPLAPEDDSGVCVLWVGDRVRRVRQGLEGQTGLGRSDSQSVP